MRNGFGSAIGVLLLGLALAATACRASVSPIERAVEVAHGACTAGAEKEDAAILLGSTIVQVQPRYIVDTCWGVSQVSGVEMVVRPLAGVSAERLAQAIRCHGARSLLGYPEASEFTADPYWLPDAWVDVETVSRDGLLAVTLNAHNITKNIRILRRAVALASERR